MQKGSVCLEINLKCLVKTVFSFTIVSFLAGHAAACPYHQPYSGSTPSMKVKRDAFFRPDPGPIRSRPTP